MDPLRAYGLRLRGLVVGALFSLLGCHDRATTVGESVPAPSSSVIQIAAGLGFCEDIPLCEKECTGGSGDRCRRLGVTYEFGHAVPIDGAHATKLYEQACDLKDPDGCLAAGRMYEFHHGVAKDDAKAAAFYTRACDMGYGAGCANEAIMLEKGRGVPMDLPKAHALFKSACEQGSGLACEHAKALVSSPPAGSAAPP